ncbi:MAG: YqgE/AlgH family protein [Granulosicoccus sp.]
MNLTHHFLISMPQMQDTGFRNSVVYILDHCEQGAFGVIVNAALGMNFESLLSQINIKIDAESARNTTVLRGGPVDEGHGLVLHEPGPSFETTREFAHGVSLSSSRDVLEAIARGEEPSTYLVVLGHSGWAPGQLEMEVAENAWLTCQADTDILFKTPLQNRRQAVASLIGIDMSNVVGHSGHA